MKDFLKVTFTLLFTLLSLTAYGVIYNSSTQSDYSQRGAVSTFNNPTYLYLLSIGVVNDATVDYVYGENPDLDTSEDVWDGGGTYTYSADSTADIVSIACGAANVHDITIEGLDQTGDYVSQTATCNGTTRVALGTALWRVNSVSNDSTYDSSGDVVVYTGTGAKPSIGTSTIRAYLHAANNRTLTSFYTIPNDMVGILTWWKAGTSRKGDANAEADIIIWTRKYSKKFQVLDRLNTNITNTTPPPTIMGSPLALPGKTDIKCTTDATVDNQGVFCAFEVILYDESLIPSVFRTKIGQP